jgi:hypothetical protein
MIQYQQLIFLLNGIDLYNFFVLCFFKNIFSIIFLENRIF